ncbi:DUF6509 family protein [Paenisporosarcina sp. TG20]|uniref:DUF6509 family protein n=1 Tax=Paenisporosarcina sp. TG20 TaxID=1211706 RepID=UPI000303AAF2|nr:DUF6509 family protein [Paenisporosarcina sp. TG20]
MEISNHVVRKINDPTGIIEGDRYEYLLDVEVEEDDELFTEGGLELRVIFASDENVQRVVKYHFTDKLSKEVLDFALEDDEEVEILEFCKNNL